MSRSAVRILRWLHRPWQCQRIAICTAGDANGDGTITVNEIIAGVSIALGLVPCGGGTGHADGNTLRRRHDPVLRGGLLRVGVRAAHGRRVCGPGRHRRWPWHDRTPAANCRRPIRTASVVCQTQRAMRSSAKTARHRTASPPVAWSRPAARVCTAATCADVPPPNPDVMCCLPNATSGEIECEDRTVSACAAGGGVSKGAGARASHHLR